MARVSPSDAAAGTTAPMERICSLKLLLPICAEKLKSEDEFILLDVRELTELNYAKITDSRLEVTPMSRLSQEGTNALSESAQSQDATLYVMCHHGTRSMQVTAWLESTGLEECHQCARWH